jgi:spore maturation protein CgeB
MKVLVFGSPSEMALGRMCARGFKSLSHEVEYVVSDYRTFPLVGTLNADNVHSRLINDVRRFDPDFMFIIKGYNLSRETVNRIQKAADVVVANWNPDNQFQVRSEASEASTYLDALPAYDIVFTWGQFLLDPLKDRGARRTAYLPFGWDPELHSPTESVDRYECDVVFLGIWSTKRQQVLSGLLDFNLDIWGNYWKTRCWNIPLRRCRRGSKLSGEEYAKAMSSAKIVVNVLADHNVPSHNMRTFEAPATESVMATTRTDGQKEFFSDEQDVIMYDDKEELRQKVAYYLDNEREREEIANSGRKAISNHTYTDRMRSVIDIMGKSNLI